MDSSQPSHILTRTAQEEPLSSQVLTSVRFDFAFVYLALNRIESLKCRIGLGLESAKHFVRLNAARVILGCRNLEKAEAAKKIIEESTQRQGVVQVWQVDLTSFESVKEFASRVDQLDRLDIFINNASMIAVKTELFEGHETQVTVNVISTALLSVLVLPALRRSGKQFNITPHLVIVSSDGAFMVCKMKQTLIYTNAYTY